MFGRSRDARSCLTLRDLTIRRERAAYGNAIQQVANDLLENNRYLEEAGVLFNEGSALGLFSSGGTILRPDITTVNQAPKIIK